MSLRLVKAGAPDPPTERRGGTALLVVDRRGAVLTESGWDSVSSSPPPKGLMAGAGCDDPLVAAMVEVLAEARHNRRPAGRQVEVSLEKLHQFAIAVAPFGSGRAERVAVTVTKTPGPSAGTAEGQVIRQLGHDLRTPLTSISGAVELMMSGRLGQVAPQQEKVLGMMQKGVDAMVRLIDESTAPFRSRKGLAETLGIHPADLAAALGEGAEPGAGGAGSKEPDGR